MVIQGNLLEDFFSTVAESHTRPPTLTGGNIWLKG